VSALVERVSDRLADLRFNLTVAESCSGGLLAATLTDFPGASRFLVAGFVTYSDTAKIRVLGVPPETLAAYGAVSEQAVRAMVAGARTVGESEVGVAVTGIAGPGGGTPDKPVGTVWVAVSVQDRTEARLHRFEGSRAAVREAAVRAALDMLDGMLEGP
jgi:PncC family amidohydrolase